MVHEIYTPLRKWLILSVISGWNATWVFWIWALVGKCPKGFPACNYAAAKKSFESQVPATFKYRKCHVFHLWSLLPTSSFQCQLAYIFYESTDLGLCGVLCVYRTFKSKFSGRMYRRGIYHITMIYTLHSYIILFSLNGTFRQVASNSKSTSKLP